MDSSQPNQRRTRIRVWVLVILFVLLPALGLVAYRVTGDRVLQRRLESIRAQGHPVTLEELNDSDTPPADVDNAADLYLEAFDYITLWDSRADANMPVSHKLRQLPRTTPLPPHLKRGIEKRLAENSENLTLLHEAAALRHCRYASELSKGLPKFLPWQRETRSAAFVLQLEAIYHADINDVDLALRSAASCMALARSADSNFINGELFQEAIHKLGIEVTAYVLNRVRCNDSQLVRISETIAHKDYRADLRRAIVAERCVGIAIFQGTVPVDAETFPWGRDGPAVTWLSPLRTLGILQRDALSYLDVFQDSLDSLTGPIPEVLTKAKDLDESLSSSGGKFFQAMTRIMPIILQAYIKREAYRSTALTGLAVERYRLAHGSLPESLAQLVPACIDEVPIDPYDGEPLRYRRLNPGFVVYSIGINGKDDSGKEPASPSRKRSGERDSDITFIVER